MKKFYKAIYKLSLTAILILAASSSYSQQTPVQTAPAPAQHTYPRFAAYVGVVHPLATFTKNGGHTNFDGFYQVGFPVGINLWKSAKVGFSAEFVPHIRVEDDATGTSVSKMNNFLFHPGVLLGLGNGYTFVGRAAFETSGRYGVTPIINKVIKKNKHSNYLIAIPVPVRFGNAKPSSIGVSLQFALGF